MTCVESVKTKHKVIEKLERSSVYPIRRFLRIPDLKQVNTKRQFLQALEKFCEENKLDNGKYTEPISYEQFEDMSIEELATLRKIGDEPYCLSLESLFNTVKNNLASRKPTKHPLTNKSLGPMLERFVISDAKAFMPGSHEVQHYVAPFFTIDPSMQFVYNVAEPFVEIGYKVPTPQGIRVIGLGVLPYVFPRNPWNLEPSHSVVNKLTLLFNAGRLLVNYDPPFECCRIHLGKDRSYWNEGNAIEKYKSICQEIDDLLF